MLREEVYWSRVTMSDCYYLPLLHREQSYRSINSHVPIDLDDVYAKKDNVNDVIRGLQQHCFQILMKSAMIMS